MRVALLAAAICWPLLLGAAWADQAHGHATVASAVVYAAAGRVCHQRADRSFVSDGQQWPVCGRCSGLYLAAPFGAIAAFVRRSSRDVRRVRLLLVMASVPTVATLLWEWGTPLAMSSWVRFLAALPLGAAVAAVLVGVTTEARRAIR